jgi:PPM family protein phosphatase
MTHLSDPERASDVELAIRSDTGGRRTNGNAYDSGTTESGELVFAIAHGADDGTGGAASQLAVAATLQGYREGPVAWGPGRRLRNAVRRANVGLHERARLAPNGGRSSPMLTAAVVSDRLLLVVHVGDSRVYLVRADLVSQLSTDPAGTTGWAARSLAPPALGQSPTPRLDRFSLRLVSGDQVVLCTKGVYSLLHEEEVRDFCRDRTAVDACRTFLKVAKQRDPTDNLTVAVLILHHGASLPMRRTWRARLFDALRLGG